MERVVLILNLIASLASAGWAIVAVVRPGLMSASTSPSSAERFFCRMYAARAVPIGLLAGFLPIVLLSPVVPLVLLTAAAVQIADMAIALANHDPRMSVGAALGGAIHLGCALMLT